MTPTPRAPAIRSWDDLRADALGCTRCRLAQGRTKVVFGVGDPQASLMFVGEAPGFHEDRTGEPFVGRAGQLLDQLCAEVGLSRDAGVYIANVLKCRPPGNRDPQPDEIEACRPYLAEQIAAIDPGVIVTLGAFAMRLLLADVRGGPADPSKVPVGKVAGYRFDYDGRTLIPTYHPAAALRGNDAALEALRRDLRLAAAVLSGRAPTAAEALQAARAATADDSDRPPAASGSAAEPTEAGPEAPPVPAGDLATAQLRLL